MTGIELLELKPALAGAQSALRDAPQAVVHTVEREHTTAVGAAAAQTAVCGVVGGSVGEFGHSEDGILGTVGCQSQVTASAIEKSLGGLQCRRGDLLLGRARGQFGGARYRDGLAGTRRPPHRTRQVRCSHWPGAWLRQSCRCQRQPTRRARRTLPNPQE
jgi:hypothetical protein